MSFEKFFKRGKVIVVVLGTHRLYNVSQVYYQVREFHVSVDMVQLCWAQKVLYDKHTAGYLVQTRVNLYDGYSPWKYSEYALDSRFQFDC